MYDEAQAEFDRKNKAYEEIEAKYLSEIKRSEENDGVQTEANNKDPLTERKIALDILEKRAKEEKEKHTKVCKLTRDISLKSLETGLRALFHALVGLSRNCFEIYRDLHIITSNYKPLEKDQ